jgi:hypothetical protein
MKFLILFIPLLAFSQNSSKACGDPSCSKTPLINKVTFDPPKDVNSEGQVIISGKDFPDCAEDTTVTFAGKNLKITTGGINKITAKIAHIDYQDGSYNIQVYKTKCSNKIAIMDASITNTVPPTPPTEFTTRTNSNVAVYPYSTLNVEVACENNEKPISGGFMFTSEKLDLVASYPEGNLWKFVVYNNSAGGFSGNEFYAVCVH